MDHEHWKSDVVIRILVVDHATPVRVSERSGRQYVRCGVISSVKQRKTRSRHPRGREQEEGGRSLPWKVDSLVTENFELDWVVVEAVLA